MATNNYSTSVGGASNPVPGGQLYFGTVAAVSNGKLKVNVPMLGFTSTPCDHLNAYGNDRYAVGERVVVGFLDGGKENLVVFGRVNHGHVVFPTYQQYLTLRDRVTALEVLVQTMSAQISALGVQLSNHSH